MEVMELVEGLLSGTLVAGAVPTVYHLRLTVGCTGHKISNNLILCVISVSPSARGYFHFQNITSQGNLLYIQISNAENSSYQKLPLYV